MVNKNNHKKKWPSLKELFNAFNEQVNYVQRNNISENNFAVTLDNTRKLMDMFFSIDMLSPHELPCIRKSQRIVKAVRGGYGYGRYKWNDIYSISKVCDSIGLSFDRRIFTNVESYKVPIY